MSVRQGFLGRGRARRGPLSRSVIAFGAVAVLALSGCASGIAGSPLAADAVIGAGNTDNGSGPADGGDDAGGLPLPSDGQTPNLSDLEGLLGSLGGTDGQMPDMSQLEGLLGSAGGQMPDMSQLQGLLDGLTGTGGGDADISGLIDQLGGTGGLGALNSGCLQVSGALMSVGFLFMNPLMGQPLDAQAVQSAFEGLKDMPAEVQGDIQALKAAAESAVGKSGAEAQKIADSPAVTDAMDHISQYLDASCGGN